MPSSPRSAARSARRLFPKIIIGYQVSSLFLGQELCADLEEVFPVQTEPFDEPARLILCPLFLQTNLMQINNLNDCSNCTG